MRMRVEYSGPTEYGFSADSYKVEVDGLAGHSVRIEVTQVARVYQEGDLGARRGYLILPAAVAQKIALGILTLTTHLPGDHTHFQYDEAE